MNDGAIHLTNGAVTLRLQHEAFLAITDTVVAAARELVLRSLADAARPEAAA